MLSGNNSNPYLTNDGYYRQNLSSVKNKDMYYRDMEDSDVIKNSIMLAGLVAASGGTALSFYKSGSFQKYMNKFLYDFATSEGVRKFTDASDGVKKVTEREGYNVFQDAFDIVHNDVLKNSIDQGVKKRAAEQLLEDTELVRNIIEKNNVLKNISDQGITGDVSKIIGDKIDDVLKKSHVYDAEKNAKLMKQIGFREAKVRDVMGKGLFTDTASNLINEQKAIVPDIMDKVVDKNIMVSMTGDIVDFRTAINSLRNMGTSAVRDFQIPILGINPLKMFYVDTLIEENKAPLFHTIGAEEVQPYISGRTTELKSNYIYAGGTVIDTVTGKVVKQNMELANGRGGMYAINSRRLTGIETMKKTARWDNPIGRLLFKGAKALDLGMQDEIYRQGLDILAPGTWLPWMSQIIDDAITPVKNEYVKDLSSSYGKGINGEDTKYLVMNKSKGIKEEGFIKQLFAGRDNLNDVTKATHVPYMLMERMNASLQAFRLGLSSDSIGSMGAVFTNLMSKRILPVVVAIGVIKYADYMMENKDGYSPKDAMADTYVTASVNSAALKDKLGITDFMKRLKNLTPGWEQLEELPIIGRLFSTKNKEETAEYWENGEDPVRKGRYWSLGNTPYTGGRTDYFRPNWVRRMKSDYKFTDVAYGSKEEYFDNWWLPTPTAPLAPVRHFFTNPYHYEDKHYKDRPYPITGGINELKEIPIIGGFLDATIGRVLKPREKMHLEYWDGERLKEAESAEYTPYQETSRPADGLRGAPGRYAIPTSKKDEYESVSYVTSSGQITIMAKPKDEDIRMINEALKKVSIKKSGAAGEVSRGTPMYGPHKDETLIPVKPGSMASVFEDSYHDITELAGFYGFSFTSLAGEGTIKRPRVQSSSELQSYSRDFWEKNLGGFGGEISEIFRRFAPNKSAEIRNSELNPIRNTMPTWMPGKDYYVDFLHGDPYIKANEGEYRLPGGGYEALNPGKWEDIKRMHIGASLIGYDKSRIAEHILQADSVQDEQKRFVTDRGTKWHKKWEKEMDEDGIAISMEQYVEDKENAIGGFYDVYAKHDKALNWLLENAVDFTFYKAADGDGDSQEGFYNKIEVAKMSEEDQAQFYKDLLTISENVLIDPKTRTKKIFENDEMHFENVQQVNFYASQMGTRVNYLIHVDVTNPKTPIKVFGFEQNDKLLDYTINKVQETRQGINTLMDQGILNPGDLYSYFDRFKILADVAPYSENFRHYDRLMSQIDLDEKQLKEVAEIREQVSERKQQMRLYPYRFKTANLKYENVTVKQVLDDGSILTNEYDNPIKLAGIDFSTDLTKPEGKEAMGYLKKRLRKGQTINIGYTADPIHKFEKDTYRSIKAVVQTRAGNLNMQMTQKGYAEENEDDNSPAAIHARFTKGEIIQGTAWETLAHRDTYFHTKFMQTRSALEMYKRQDVYGKSWQEWTHPIRDFLLPSMQNQMSKGMFWGTFMGAMVGSMFGKTRYGKIVGAAIGGSTMLVGSTITRLNEAITGDAYIPRRRQKERELNEYIDILKYVKNRKLFEQYRQEAIKKEGVDPVNILNENKKEGESRKRGLRLLTSIKQDLHNGRITFKEARKTAKLPQAKTQEELMDLINAEIERLKNYREVSEITPLAAQAIMYYNESEKTVYGYDPGEPLQNILSALNRKERKYFQPFLEAPEEERGEILKLVPRYMRRALQSAYGVDVDDKPELEEYFKYHALPDENWAGWSPDVDLEDVKVKMVKHEGMDMSEFDYWSDDEIRAEHLDIPMPKINYHQTAGMVRQKLRDVLRETGLNDVDVQVTVTNSEDITMDVDIENDRTEEIKEYVRNYGII